ncbi:MAG: hypothetical protein AAGD14_13270 [Planctomycetota bacterium]
MNRRHLCALVGALFAVGCQSAHQPEEPARASREEVTLALYRQLRLVLERHDELSALEDPAADAEREELVRLAAEIAVRIARIDPQVNMTGLAQEMGPGEG